MAPALVLTRAAGDWTVLGVTPDATRLIGWAPADLTACGGLPFAAPAGPFDRELRAALATGRAAVVGGDVIGSDGDARPVSLRIVPMDGGVLALCLLGPADAPLDSAQRDPLTGLGNRAALERDLGLALSRATRHGSSVAVLFVDLDRFKQINDDHGHAAGDAVLVEAARRLRTVVRAHDHVVRLGGDEFVVVLTDIAERARERGETVAAKIGEAMSVPVVLDGTSVAAPASVGVAVFPDEAGGARDLLAAADAGMYRAKRDRPGVTGRAREDLLARARRAEAHARDLRQTTKGTIDAARAAMAERRRYE